MSSLEIKFADWLKIFFFSVVFGALFGASVYILASAAFYDGVVLGIVSGVFIASFAAILITAGNNIIMPNIEEKYWYFVSFALSFMSGFYGSIIAVYVTLWFGIEVLLVYYSNLIFFSSMIGLMTYLIGFVMYMFVKSRNKTEEIEEEYEKNRLLLLQLQLNPHFLFNSLNSIAELVHMDAKKAEKALMDLGVFFRNTLDQNLIVRLSEELEFVKNYIAIENVRFNNNIQIEVLDKTENIRNIFVPKFSIQLLVENSIKHNNPSRKILSITILIEKTISDLKITVRDNGKGVRDFKFGIGLSNLKERLKLLNNGQLENLPCESGATFQILLKEKYENFDN